MQKAPNKVCVRYLSSGKWVIMLITAQRPGGQATTVKCLALWTHGGNYEPDTYYIMLKKETQCCV